MRLKPATISIFAATAISLAALASERMHKESHVSQTEVQYAQPFGPQGPSFGFVQGAFGKLGTPTAMFIKVKAGFDSGWHDHDNDYEGVVMKGTFSEQQKGEASETMLPTGTYFTQPGKIAHRNGCSKESDCLLYVRFANGANSHPTTPDGKRLPPPSEPARAAR